VLHRAEPRLPVAPLRLLQSGVEASSSPGAEARLPAAGARRRGEHAAWRPRRAGSRDCVPALGLSPALAWAGRCRAAHELGGEEYAVKVVALRKYEDRALVARERRALELLRGAPRVVQLRRAYLAARRAHLVFECAPGPGRAGRYGAHASECQCPGAGSLAVQALATQTRAGTAAFGSVSPAGCICMVAQRCAAARFVAAGAAEAASLATSRRAGRRSVSACLSLSAPQVRPTPGSEGADCRPRPAGCWVRAARCASCCTRRPARCRPRSCAASRASCSRCAPARAGLCAAEHAARV
jgi:hypothetical protein